MNEPAGEIVLYRGDDGRAVIQMRAVRGTVWLSRSQMAELYGTTSQNIGPIISRVLADGEVDQATRNSEFLVQAEGPQAITCARAQRTAGGSGACLTDAG